MKKFTAAAVFILAAAGFMFPSVSSAQLYQPDFNAFKNPQKYSNLEVQKARLEQAVKERRYQDDIAACRALAVSNNKISAKNMKSRLVKDYQSVLDLIQKRIGEYDAACAGDDPYGNLNFKASTSRLKIAYAEVKDILLRIKQYDACSSCFPKVYSNRTLGYSDMMKTALMKYDLNTFFKAEKIVVEQFN